MKDLLHRFRVWCSPATPGAKGCSYWCDSIDEASLLRLCVLMKLHSLDFECVPLDFGMLPTNDLIACTGKVRPYLLLWNKVC